MNVKKLFILYRSLCIAKERIEAGERNPEIITNLVKDYIETYTKGTVDYADLYAYPSLTMVESRRKNHFSYCS